MDCLLTGANGFLGKHVKNALLQNGDNVVSVLRQRSGFEADKVVYCDLSKSVPDLSDMAIDKVIHVAGKAHVVPANEKEAEAFFQVNLKGTLNLLAALDKKQKLPIIFVNISTVAVYGLDSGVGVSEDYNPVPSSPYGKSKLEAEHEVTAWCIERGVRYYHLRLPLIFGNAPLGNLARMVKAINGGYYVQVKQNEARKSIVLAQDVAELIAGISNEECGAFNLTDGYDPTVNEIEAALERVLEKKIRLRIGKTVINGLVKAGMVIKLVRGRNPLEDVVRKLTASLTFSDNKARTHLGWNPGNVLHQLPIIDLNNEK